MKKTTKYGLAALGLIIMSAGLEVGGGSSTLVSRAEAVVGRPATPGSAAGVARRTTRRIVRRGAHITVLPAGCPYGVHYGYHLYYCGGVYYEKSGSGYVIVYF